MDGRDDPACHYTPMAYPLGLEFKRFRLFEKSRAGWFTERDVFGLELALLANPEAGDLIPGAKGLRKIRWPSGRRGKRGGARVIYFHAVTDRQILLLYAYAKTRQGDLTPAQTRQLAALVHEEFP
jgi:mRNA-degrading endonuclease RelE of RelBE toxin-antitoxin system